MKSKKESEHASIIDEVQTLISLSLDMSQFGKGFNV